MASKFYNLKGGDALALVEIIQNTIYLKIWNKIADFIDEVSAEVNAQIAENFDNELTPHIIKLLKESLMSKFIQLETHEEVENVTFDFVNELGIRGWEILCPAAVKKVKEVGYLRRKIKIVKNPGGKNGVQ